MRHRKLLAPIQTEKHYVQNPEFTIAAGTLGSSIIATSVAVASKDQASEVEEGSLIKAVYFELWANSNTALVGSCVITLEKRSGGQPVMTFTQSQNLGAYPNKRNLFYTTEGLNPANVDQNPLPFLRGWFKIPKGKQRMALGDVLLVNMAATTQGLKGCGFATYKEYK